MLGGELSRLVIKKGLHRGQMAGEPLLESIQRRAHGEQLGSVRQALKRLIVDEVKVRQAVTQVCKCVAKALYALGRGLGNLSCVSFFL